MKPRYFIRIVALAIAAVAIPWTPVSARRFEEPMMFRLAENSAHNLQWIAAIGTITVDTPDAFERFAKTLKTERLWVVFNSPGGKVIPALQLGELIRKHGFNSDVALTVFRGHGKDKLVPGFCMSACGYAFLGGVKREIQEGSLLGYHEIYRDPSVKLDEATNARIIKAINGYIMIYLGKMGVHHGLLKMASKEKPDEYYEPDADELIEFRIVTGRKSDAKPDTKPGPVGSAPNTSRKQSDVLPIWEMHRASIRAA